MTPIDRLQQCHQHLQRIKAQLYVLPIEEMVDAMPSVAELEHLSEQLAACRHLPSVSGFLNFAISAREQLEDARTEDPVSCISQVIRGVRYAAEKEGMGLV